jgi:hypothetical protein
MLKTTLQKSMLLTCLATVTFASCKKELDVEPVTEQVAVARKPADLMLASTAPVSKLSGKLTGTQH